MPACPAPAPSRPARRTALLATVAVATGLALQPAPTPAQTQAGHSMPAGMVMSDQAMRSQLASWYATHPATRYRATAAPQDTFYASNFKFNADHNLATAFDTVHIVQGESVAFAWITGLHTVTSGTGSLDPNAGLIFDQSMAAATDDFTFQFNDVGTFPFFCRIHETVMKGVVVVAQATGVDPIASADGALGFVTDPAPNPTREGAGFRFALRQAGRARVEVYDVRGRLVDLAFDRDLQGGVFQAAWDGRTAAGGRAGAGVYYLRLSVPGLTQSRRLVLAR